MAKIRMEPALAPLAAAAGLVVALVFGVSACNGLTDPTATQLSALSRAEAQWNAAGLHSYSFDIAERSVWFDDSLHVEVRADTVFRVTSYVAIPFTARPGTIPELFKQIRIALANGAAATATYDNRLGYPTYVNAPDPPHRADTAWRASVGNVTPLP